MTTERRADKRSLLHSSVEITGIDDAGLQFAERTHLEDIGDLGCRFLMRNAVQRGDILGIEPLGTNGENLPDEFPRLFVIARVKRKGDLLEVGARCLLEDELSDGSFHTNLSDSKVSAK